MRALSRLAVILCAFALFAATPSHAARRVALVIGIGAYQNLSPLANPVRDAAAVAASLRDHGYQVLEYTNLARGDFLNALEDFQRLADRADVALIYYAGHGMEVDGKNVLAPTDMEITCAPKQARRAVQVDDFFRALGHARNQIVLLDACRADPFPQCSSRGIATGTGFRGLLPDGQPDASLLIANSTLSGKLASDGAGGGHSPFATALLVHFTSDANEPLRDMLDRTAREVRQATNGAQIPEITTQGGAPNVCLDAENCSAIPQVVVSQIQTQQAPSPATRGAGEDKLAYDAAIKVGSCAALEAFAQAFPNSFYATLTEVRARVACAATEAAPQQRAALEPPPSTADAGFIFSDSDVRRLTTADLKGLSKAELRVARNEIYARKGRFFKSADLNAHFRQFAWYRPSAWDVALNSVESANVRLIQAEEHRR